MKHSKLPKHVAIIMDGNGRWAKSRNLQRSQGHREGVKRVEEIIAAASDMGIEVLTLYTFSTENWSRPKREVAMLMKILIQVFNQKVKKLVKKNIKFHLIGRTEGIPRDVLNNINKAIDETKGNTGMVLNMAFNYGSRLEILDAVKSIAVAVRESELDVEDINEKVFSNALYTKDLPDPDLLVRTSGEKRISNFLLWQLSYAEFYFSEKYWPDFHVEEFNKAICDYQDRERRYGKVDSQK